MDLEVAKTMKRYEKDTNYSIYLEKVLNNIQLVLSTVKNVSMDADHHSFIKNITTILTTYEKENINTLLLQSCFNNIKKVSVTYKKDYIKWSNGEDTTLSEELHIYTIVYKLYDTIITVKIECANVDDESSNLVGCVISFDEWLTFVIADHNEEELGYNDNEDRRELEICNSDQLNSFYKNICEFTSTKDVIKFYSYFICTLINQICDEYNTTLNDDLDVDETISMFTLFLQKEKEEEKEGEEEK